MSPLSSDPDRAQRQLEALAAGRRRWPGNVNGDSRSVKHGGRSVRAIGPLAKVWESRFAEHFGEITDHGWPEFLATVSRCWARLESIGGWIDLRSNDAGKPEVMAALATEQRLRAEADGYLKRLQLAPLDPSDESTRVRILLEMQNRLDAIEQRSRPEEVPNAKAE